MSFDELIVDPVWSWPLVLLASAVLIGVVLLTYPQRVRHLPPFRRRLLIGLRLTTALLLIFAMFRPAVRYSRMDEQAAQLVVLMDASRSMTTADGPAGSTRREALLRTLADNDERLQRLGKQVELRYFDFADNLSPVDTPTPAAEGRETAIGKAFQELSREDTGKRLAGVVLLSDGAQRAMGDDNVDPLAAARRLAEQRGVPIHTVTYGSSELTGAGLDLAVEDVAVDALAYEKKTVPVRFQLRTSGAAGRKVKARIVVERRSAGVQGDTVEWVEPTLTADSRPFQEYEVRGNRSLDAKELSFVAEQAGEYKVAVEVVPLEGEVKQANNRYETVITVLKGGLKVAYIDVPRAEQGKILRLNENARIQMDAIQLTGGKFLDQARIDPQVFAPGAYDVYVIGDVPASVFRQAGQDLLQQLLSRCREGAGLAMLGGAFNYGAGGYSGTAIERLLPVKMTPAERIEIGQEPPASQFLPGPVQMLPGPAGRAHYLMQLGPNNDQLWRNLPPLRNGANKLTPSSPDVSVLAWSAKQEPLLIGQDTGTTRVLALGVDDTWRWFTHGHEREHQRFWEQMLLWLARMEDQRDQPVWARVTPRNFSPGERVTLTFGAQDEQKVPIAGASYKVEVAGPGGEVTQIPAQSTGTDNVADFAGTAASGDYWVVVTAEKDGQSLGPPARTRFIVDARDPELDNPAADPDLMAEIATLSGAVPIAPEKFGEFLDVTLREGLAADVLRHTQVNLWDNWPLLLLFVLLLTTEWFVRKRRGLV